MSDFQIRRDRHHDKVMGLDAELRGVITAALALLDEGRVTPERALDLIREKLARTDAALRAAWDEFVGGDR